MHLKSFFRRILTISIVNVTFEPIFGVDDFRFMTFRKVLTSLATRHVELYYNRTLQGISRVYCFSKCTEIPTSCVGVLYDKINANGLCRLLTNGVTEEPVNAGPLETGSIAIQKTHVCERGFHLFDGHCYGVGEVQMTWNDSKLECEQIGAYLAEVDTVDENTWLATTFVYPAAEPAECFDVWSCSTWIGASRKNGGVFVWSHHGNSVTYEPWYPGEPGNRSCIHLLRSALWDDDYCDVPRKYICEKEFLNE